MLGFAERSLEPPVVTPLNLGWVGAFLLTVFHEQGTVTGTCVVCMAPMRYTEQLFICLLFGWRGQKGPFLETLQAGEMDPHTVVNAHSALDVSVALFNGAGVV